MLKPKEIIVDKYNRLLKHTQGKKLMDKVAL